MNDHEMTLAEACSATSARFLDIGNALHELCALYDRFPQLERIQPPAVAHVIAQSFDEAEAAAWDVSRAFGDVPAGFTSSDPDAFRRAAIVAGYEVSEDGAYCRTNIGFHRIEIESPDRNVSLPLAGWLVVLSLNGARVNAWSSANFQTIAAAVEYAHALILAYDGVAVGKRDPLADLDRRIRARLVDEMGFSVETVGGGGIALSSYAAPDVGHVMVTCYGGGGLPTFTDWQACAYAASDPGEPILDLSFDPADLPNGNPLTLFEAVAACLSVVAERGEG